MIGAGPAGAATALGALTARPDLSVLLLDRSSFPRDKACGDGVAPHVLDLLQPVGGAGLLDDVVPVHRLRLRRDGVSVVGSMRRAAWVVPRTVFDQRLVELACSAGAVLACHRVRRVEVVPGRPVEVDDVAVGRVLVGADGAHSVVRRTLGLSRPPTAVALRGYAPTSTGRRGEQVIVFGSRRPLSYAWSFDRGDGLANVGYGQMLTGDRPAPPRKLLVERLERLLPGATSGATAWRGHLLPVSSWRWTNPPGRVLLAGDAAGLVNPLTGEGIYHAVATGLLAGRIAAAEVSSGCPDDAGSRYRRAARRQLGWHRRHTAVAARLVRQGAVLDAGLRAAATDGRVFDDLVEMGLGRGRLTGPVLRGLARELVVRR